MNFIREGIGILFFLNTALGPNAFSNEQTVSQNKLDNQINESVQKIEVIQTVGYAMLVLKQKLSKQDYKLLEDLLKRSGISGREPISFKKKDTAVAITTKVSSVKLDFSEAEFGVIGINKTKIYVNDPINLQQMIKLINDVFKKNEVAAANAFFALFVPTTQALETKNAVILGLAAISTILTIALLVSAVPVSGPMAVPLGMIALNSIKANLKKVKEVIQEENALSLRRKELIQKTCLPNSLFLKEKLVGIGFYDGYTGEFSYEIEGRTVTGFIKKASNGKVSSVTVEGKEVDLSKLPALNFDFASALENAAAVCSNGYQLSLKSKTISPSGKESNGQKQDGDVHQQGSR